MRSWTWKRDKASSRSGRWASVDVNGMLQQSESGTCLWQPCSLPLLALGSALIQGSIPLASPVRLVPRLPVLFRRYQDRPDNREFCIQTNYKNTPLCRSLFQWGPRVWICLVWPLGPPDLSRSPCYRGCWVSQWQARVGVGSGGAAAAAPIKVDWCHILLGEWRKYASWFCHWIWCGALENKPCGGLHSFYGRLAP